MAAKLVQLFNENMKLTKPVKRQNLYLTINRKVQLTAQQAILDQIATIRHPR